jgi:hypothetical protein
MLLCIQMHHGFESTTSSQNIANKNSCMGRRVVTAVGGIVLPMQKHGVGHMKTCKAYVQGVKVIEYRKAMNFLR